MRPGLVRVILSTYNSERFIRPLLDSVLWQTYAPTELWVRDDGSSDGTGEILSQYAQRNAGRMRVFLEPNVGMVRSYFTVIHAAGTDAEFTAFCDHDDVWHADKITRAVEMLRARGDSAPLMYTGRLHIVDNELRHLGYSEVPARPMSLRNALVENVAAGCTMVMNPAARDLLLEGDDLGGIWWPDWWFYLLVSAFGTVLYDERPCVEYRRHGGNAVGSPSVWSGQRVRQAWLYLNRLFDQAEALRLRYGTRLPAEQLATLVDFLDAPTSLLGRVRHAMTCRVYRQRALDGAVIRAFLLTRPVPS